MRKRKAAFQNLENRMVTGDPGHAYPQGWNRTGDFSSRVSMYGNLILLVIPARIELATYRLGVWLTTSYTVA